MAQGQLLPPRELLAQLKEYTTNMPAEVTQDTDLRSQLYWAAQDAVRALETPADLVSRVAVSQPLEWILLRIGCEIGLFPALRSESKTLSQLEKEIKVDPALLVRIVRACVGFGTLKEVGSDKYSLSHSCARLAEHEVAEALPAFADWVHTVYYTLPPYLKDTGYKNPHDSLHAALQRAFDAPGVPPYELLGTRPQAAKGIGVILEVMGDRRHKSIEHMYPIKERLIDGFDPSVGDVFFVDIGAGHSHVIGSIKETIENVPGKMVGQDLQYMIDSAPEHVKSHMQAYNFFDEQPIKGARAYYVRLCLHSWNDEDVTKILTHIYNAMKPGYSRMIIHEQVILERGTQFWVSAADISCMSTTATGERTEKHLRALLDGVGFKDIKLYWPSDPSCEVAIEAVR